MHDPDTDPFPLECWFDLTAPISPSQAQSALDSMSFNARRSGTPRRDPGLQRSRARLRAAVRQHNAQYETPGH